MYSPSEKINLEP